MLEHEVLLSKPRKLLLLGKGLSLQRHILAFHA